MTIKYRRYLFLCFCFYFIETPPHFAKSKFFISAESHLSLGGMCSTWHAPERRELIITDIRVFRQGKRSKNVEVLTFVWNSKDEIVTGGKGLLLSFFLSFFSIFFLHIWENKDLHLCRTKASQTEPEQRATLRWM